jgi:predicted transcriptional regulator
MGRPSKKEMVLNNLDKIAEMSSRGLTKQNIANQLGVSISTLQKYTSEIKEIDECIKENRKRPVAILEGVMFKAAKGSELLVKKHMKVKNVEYWENGKKKREWEEVVEYEELEIIRPDIGAGAFLLKNWGGYANEPRVVEIRQKDLELKKKQAEKNDW